MAFCYLTPKAHTLNSPVSGRGSFAKEPISRGELVALFGGHVHPLEQWNNIPAHLRDLSLSIWPGFGLGPISDEELSHGDFINHSCEPNCGIVGQITLVAMKDIAAGSELCFDYGTVVFDHGDEPFKMPCLCGTASCRGEVTSNDWKDPAFQARYQGFLSSAIQMLIAKSR
jgi:hypothetical protein